MKINENRLNKIIDRCVKLVINEGASSILYHYLDMEYLLDLLRHNSFRTCEPEMYLDFDNKQAQYVNGNDIRFISFTRNGNPAEGYPRVKYGEFGDGELSCVCRLTIDGNLLNRYNNFKDKEGKRQNLKVKPIDWAYYDMASEHGASNGKTWMMNSSDSTYDVNYWDDNIYSSESSHGEYNDIYHHPYSQAEDRLLTKAKFIPNANKYIKKIDILIRDNEEYESEIQKLRPMIFEIQELAHRLNIPIFIHNNIKQFKSK